MVDGESEEEDQERSPPVPFDSQAISDVIPGSASVIELSLALVELQRNFKISVAAMDRVAELVQIATGENSGSPSFARPGRWRKNLTSTFGWWTVASTMTAFLKTRHRFAIKVAFDNMAICINVPTVASLVMFWLGPTRENQESK